MFQYLFFTGNRKFYLQPPWGRLLTVNSLIKIADAVCTKVAAWEAQAIFNAWQPS
jgi:hypothetical protein